MTKYAPFAEQESRNFTRRMNHDDIVDKYKIMSPMVSGVDHFHSFDIGNIILSYSFKIGHHISYQ